MTNNEIANRLLSHARELYRRHDNLYRVKAYRHAAESVMRLDCPIEKLLQAKGRNALEQLPGIGRHLAATITEFVQTGEWKPGA
ncbi:MAG: hypothetical protein K8T89_13675 [Planctomycetes bacterium]|nr:hypothetical protein [Planctomycetota bacterium]